MSTSTDGGPTGGPARINNSGGIGGHPVERPDGTSLVLTATANDAAIVPSNP